MKKKSILILIFLFSLNMFSQHKEKRERMKAYKVSFITTELSLTSDEAAKFWPIYNEFERKQFEVKHKKMRLLIKKLDHKIDTMSDKEALIYLNKLEAAEKELFDLNTKLVKDLKAILKPIKILKLKKAEGDFNRKLLYKYKHRKKR
ncbi:MAG: sensor of ECF-type sigma factor [Flavobacterium sp. MedPE-SWcel]|uniref:sensor of ECF-type sigma factor n=1 Tax=uncultured Flavobacterium sp. TaxID=165435 RepID=UPI0009157A1E|nr:sensor of ECF-type sigma factor [uncultured Flavobacterium sp.]OIQ18645.1 MAG: sensor of ECF-type sigma factor [Flavobacterium sp. MedPE-SWcel]